MTNQEYVGMLTRCNGLNQQRIQQRLLKAMQKYTYSWWLTLDYKELAYYQLLENDALLCDYNEYRCGLKELFGRPIYALLLEGENKKELQEEALTRFGNTYELPNQTDTVA